MLVYSADIETLRGELGKYKVEPFKLEDKECGRGVYGGKIEGKSGLFSLTADGQTIPERRVFKRSAFAAEKKILAALEQQYLVYKMQFMVRYTG